MRDYRSGSKRVISATLTKYKWYFDFSAVYRYLNSSVDQWEEEGGGPAV